MTLPINLNEYALRNKIRFPSAKGDLTLEQLWDVPLRSRDDFNLNAVAQAANRAWKTASEESFVSPQRTPAHARLEAALEIVKDIIERKLEEEELAKAAADKKIEKAKLLEILQEKQDGKLSDLSIKELQRRISELEE